MISRHAFRNDAPSRRIRRSLPWITYRSFPLTIFVFALLSGVAFISGKEWKPKVKETSDAELFTPSDAMRSISFPSTFPKPTRMIDDTAVPIVEPTFGKHRAQVDAVLAYAEGYALPYYRMFLETLHDTGFTGDVVLAIAEPALVKPEVEDYLRTYTLAGDDDGQLHVVVYQTALVCEARDGTLMGRRTLERGELDVFQMCRLHHVYGWKVASRAARRTRAPVASWPPYATSGTGSGACSIRSRPGLCSWIRAIPFFRPIPLATCRDTMMRPRCCRMAGGSSTSLEKMPRPRASATRPRI
jgi:hypothetical protein